MENKNALCVLGLNMINDKIFMVLWFWFAFLVLIGTYRVFYRIAQIFSWRVRQGCHHYPNNYFLLIISVIRIIIIILNTIILIAQIPSLHAYTITILRYQLLKWKIRRYFIKTENDQPVRYYIQHCSIGDWLVSKIGLDEMRLGLFLQVLYQMSRNMNKRFFSEFIYMLAR